ncbi:hypothetical protein [Candidatus Binatus sp.]|jgi:hypothetical protein|uniref:hypothetical protein n=1 Tax=Candidatus Binatus sp. TaxID=2811406 RepID=UPI003CB1B8EF
MHLLRFLVFCFAYFVFAIASARLTSKATTHGLRTSNAFAFTELTILLSTAGMFSFIYLLSGFGSVALMALVFAGAQLGVIVTGILWGFLGSSETEWGLRSLWAGNEFGLKHPITMVLGLLFSIVAFLGYPIVAAILYFRHPISSPELEVRTIQLTLLLSTVAGLPLSLPVIVGTLSSENLDEGTRSRFLVAQFGGLVPFALYLALFYWTLPNPNRESASFLNTNIPLQFPLILPIILISYLASFILIPYLIGWLRGRTKRLDLLKKEEGWLTDLVKTLEAPTGKSHAAELGHLIARFGEKWKNFLDSDKMLLWGITMSQTEDSGKTVAEPNLDATALVENASQLPEQAPFTEGSVEAFRGTRDYDPRFQHVEWFNEFSGQTSNIMRELETSVNPDKANTTAKDWAEFYRHQREELRRQIKAAEKFRAPSVAALSLIASVTITPLVDQFAKKVIEHFVHA